MGLSFTGARVPIEIPEHPRRLARELMGFDVTIKRGNDGQVLYMTLMTNCIILMEVSSITNE